MRCTPQKGVGGVAIVVLRQSCLLWNEAEVPVADLLGEVIRGMRRLVGMVKKINGWLWAQYVSLVEDWYAQVAGDSQCSLVQPQCVDIVDFVHQADYYLVLGAQCGPQFEQQTGVHVLVVVFPVGHILVQVLVLMVPVDVPQARENDEIDLVAGAASAVLELLHGHFDVVARVLSPSDRLM